MSNPSVEVHPVTPARIGDLETLFESRGSPHFCWCSVYRSGAQTKAAKKASLLGMVSERIPVGVLGYLDGTPVGWCSVAPRETYAKLERSRTMPRVTDNAASTWAVMCFFVKRAHRGQGITRIMLDGAVDYARRSGAEIVEGYPHDTAGITATHRGHSALFEAAGFERNGSRWHLAV